MPEVPESILSVVKREARAQGVVIALILAIAQTESSMRPNALGDYDAEGVPHSFGLMQLYDKGAGFGHTPEELLNLSNNVTWGTSYLKGCVAAFPGDVYTAISAYNQGIGGARSRGWGFNAPYVQTVIRWMEAFSGEPLEPGPDPPKPPGCWTVASAGLCTIIGLGTILLEVVSCGQGL